MENTKATVVKKKKQNVFVKLADSNAGVPVASIILSLLMLALLSAIYGANPIEVIARLLEGSLGGTRQFVFTLAQTTPLILSALAVYIPYRTGFFNVGGQGQIQVAALASVLVTLHVGGPPAIVVPLAIIAGMAAAVVAVLIPLFLKLKQGANEVTTTLMMTFALTHLVYALVITVFKDPDAFFGTTRVIPRDLRMPIFPEAIGLHIGIYIAVIVAVAAWWILKNTTWGMQLKATGLNPQAAKVAGIKVNKMTISSVVAGAACAGLAGSIQVLGITFRVAEEWALGWGFTGISIAFLGGNPLIIIPVAFILASIETGSRFMQATTGVPSAISNVMQGLPVVIFIALNAWRSLRAMRANTLGGE